MAATWFLKQSKFEGSKVQMYEIHLGLLCNYMVIDFILCCDRIVCAYHGMYVLHEVALSASENTTEQRVRFPGGPPNVFGRCFIEVRP